MIERVRAVIIRNNRILTIERILPDRKFWVFPGGGVEDTDKNLESALKRECREEAGIDIKVRKLIWKRNYKESTIEYFYLCNIQKGVVQKGNGPEYSELNIVYKGTHSPKWLSLKDLGGYLLRPEILRNEIIKNADIQSGKTIDFEQADWSSLSR